MRRDDDHHPGGRRRGLDERGERGIATLPGSLGEAIDHFAGSKLMRETLGDHVFESFLENKRIEWNEYRAYVTDFEIKRYFPIL